MLKQQRISRPSSYNGSWIIENDSDTGVYQSQKNFDQKERDFFLFKSCNSHSTYLSVSGSFSATE